MKRTLLALTALALILGAGTASAVQCFPSFPGAARPTATEALEAELFEVPAAAQSPAEPLPLAGSCTADDRAACRQDCCVEGSCDGFQVVFSQTQGVCICNCLGFCDGLASPPSR